MRKCTVLLLVMCLVMSSLLAILPTGLAQTKPVTPTTFTVGFSDEIGYYINRPLAKLFSIVVADDAY